MNDNLIPAHFVSLTDDDAAVKPWRTTDRRLSNLGKFIREICLATDYIIFNINTKYLLQIQHLFMIHDLKLESAENPSFRSKVAYSFNNNYLTNKQQTTYLYMEKKNVKPIYKTKFVPNVTPLNNIDFILQEIKNIDVVLDDPYIKLSKIASDIGEIYLSAFFYNKSTTENKFLIHPLSALHWVNCSEKYDINILNQIMELIDDQYKPYFKNILWKLRTKSKDEQLTSLIEKLNEYQLSPFYPFEPDFYYGLNYINHLINEDKLDDVMTYIKKKPKYLSFIIDNPKLDFTDLYEVGEAYLLDEKLDNKKKINYYMAQMLLSDLQPSRYEIILQHLIQADDYLDSRELRSKLFHKWYFNEPFSNDFNLDVNLETIINIVKKMRLKYLS
mgnify:CR=1 FL=1